MGDVVKIDLEELERIMQGTDKAGTELRDVIKKLRDPYTGLVPDQWEGQAATDFSKQMDALLAGLDKLTTAVEKTPKTIERIARRLAEGHKQGQTLVKQAGQTFTGPAGTANP